MYSCSLYNAVEDLLTSCVSSVFWTIHCRYYEDVRVYIIMKIETRGRILGRNWDKSLKSFPPCYSQSPLPTDFTLPPWAKVVWNWFVMETVYMETSSLRTLQIKPRNFNEIVRSWIRLLHLWNWISTFYNSSFLSHSPPPSSPPPPVCHLWHSNGGNT
jgi:hypothetical protein